MGIVSTLARDERVTLQNCVDYVFYVPRHTSWEGRYPEPIVSRPHRQRLLQ